MVYTNIFVHVENVRVETFLNKTDLELNLNDGEGERQYICICTARPREVAQKIVASLLKALEVQDEPTGS